MSNKHTINNLPAVVREDGIVDVPRNSMNVTTVEAEYDRAMASQADYERKYPVKAAVGSLVHSWKSNRFNSCYSYGDMLSFYMKQPEWEQIKEALKEHGIPTTMESWNVVNNNHAWKLRAELVKQRPTLAKKMFWYEEYCLLAAENHPCLKGEWNG